MVDVKWKSTIIESPSSDGGKHYAIYVGPQQVEKLQTVQRRGENKSSVSDDQWGTYDAGAGI